MKINEDNEIIKRSFYYISIDVEKVAAVVSVAEGGGWLGGGGVELQVCRVPVVRARPSEWYACECGAQE